MQDTLYSSRSVEWETPKALYDLLNKEFRFDLDACATDENHKCEKYFTRERNGLAQSWAGHRVWCNPPYGRTIIDWVEKAYTESRIGAKVVVMLLPARTDTLWFHEFVYGKAEIRFIRGRLKFGGAKNNAPFPSMIAIYRKEHEG